MIVGWEAFEAGPVHGKVWERLCLWALREQVPVVRGRLGRTGRAAAVTGLYPERIPASEGAEGSRMERAELVELECCVWSAQHDCSMAPEISLLRHLHGAGDVVHKCDFMCGTRGAHLEQTGRRDGLFGGTQAALLCLALAGSWTPGASLPPHCSCKGCSGELVFSANHVSPSTGDGTQNPLL